MIKEDFKGISNAKFSVLDVSSNLAEQGFEDQQFDLIVATHAINTGNDIHGRLRNLRELLSLNGRLLLQEPRPGLLWAKFALGTLPDWWSHAEDLNRNDGPFMSAEKWQDALATTGFSNIEYVEQSTERWTNHVLIARSQALQVPVKRVTLLESQGNESKASLIVSELGTRGYEIDHRSLGETLPKGQDVIALLEEEQPFFHEIDADQLTQFKSLLSVLGNDGLLWVTRLSNVGCTDPRYAQVIGLARTIRSEMALDFAILETDKIETLAGASAVINVLSKFQTRQDDGVLGPDLEYAIHKGQTLVNRILRFSLDEDLLVPQDLDEAVVTQQYPGRLNTLNWSTTSATAPQHDEIEVEIFAAGLIFRDV